jgi:dolichol-phosphate mannosyltransferase
MEKAEIAVIVPCYRVKDQVERVLDGIGPECRRIYVVDDACPEGTGDWVEERCRDPRLRVLRHGTNQGVGAATLTGYRAALDDGAEILVKIDGDGQMDPSAIPPLVAPILEGEADYVKGNRFHSLEDLRGMPAVRLVGNSILSFLTKLSTGYWDLFDPTNGFTALDAGVARELPFDKLARRYFFESDLLFRLGTQRAVVRDVPMPARYGGEPSSLSVREVAGEFLWKNLRNFGKRIFYGYFLRDFNIASVELVLGALMLAFGTVVGVDHWVESGRTGRPATAGTVMLAALPVMIGVQLLLGFLGYDMQNVPSRSQRPHRNRR